MSAGGLLSWQWNEAAANGYVVPVSVICGNRGKVCLQMAKSIGPQGIQPLQFCYSFLKMFSSGQHRAMNLDIKSCRLPEKLLLLNLRQVSVGYANVRIEKKVQICIGRAYIFEMELSLMTRDEAKAFITEYQRDMSVSALALCFFMENGSAKIKEMTEEEFSAAADEEVARVAAKNEASRKEAEKTGAKKHTIEIGCSKEMHMKSFRLAKKFAEMNPEDLVALLGNGCYSRYYHQLMD